MHAPPLPAAVVLDPWLSLRRSTRSLTKVLSSAPLLRFAGAGEAYQSATAFEKLTDKQHIKKPLQSFDFWYQGRPHAKMISYFNTYYRPYNVGLVMKEASGVVKKFTHDELTAAGVSVNVIPWSRKPKAPKLLEGPTTSTTGGCSVLVACMQASSKRATVLSCFDGVRGCGHTIRFMLTASQGMGYRVPEARSSSICACFINAMHSGWRASA